MVCAMPNTNPAVTNETSLKQVEVLYEQKAMCDYGLYMGATEQNAKIIPDLCGRVCGLKMYLNETFNALKMNRIEFWMQHFENWPKYKPICCHAEEHSLAAVLFLAELFDRHVHICHVSSKEDVFLIRSAKERGIKVTCEVTAHHLFLTHSIESLSEREKGKIARFIVCLSLFSLFYVAITFVFLSECCRGEAAPERGRGSKSTVGEFGCDRHNRVGSCAAHASRKA